MKEPGAGLVRLDHQGRITEMDAAACAIWGEDFTGRPFHDVIAGDDEWLPPDGVEACRRDGSKVPIRWQMRCHHEGSLLRVWDDSVGQERRRQLVENEHQLRQAQRLAGIGSWSWDLATGRTIVSDELLQIYGLGRDDVGPTFEEVFGPIQERLHPDDRARVMDDLQRMPAAGEPVSAEFRIVLPNGTRWIRTEGSTESVDGTPVRIFGISQDVTEQHEAAQRRQELLQQQSQVARLTDISRARAMMLNTLAHELNTPLTPMRLQAQVLKRGLAGPLTDEQQAAMKVLDRNLQRLADLISDVLDVARLDSGRLPIHAVRTDLVAAVKAAEEVFRPQAEDAGMELTIDVPDALPAVADADRIRQVLDNLISNAIKFSDEGGEVTVTAGQRADEVWLAVSDDGIGLDEDQMTKIFVPFGRAHDDSTRPGNGLGLHICKGIVEGHGGTIAASSDGPGRGARFELSLPAHVDQTVAAPVSADH